MGFNVTYFVSFIYTASLINGVFIVAASYAECDRVLVILFFAISIGFLGVPIIAVNTIDLSPNYAGILMGFGGTLTSVTGIIVPYIIGIVTPNVSQSL